MEMSCASRSPALHQREQQSQTEQDTQGSVFFRSEILLTCLSFLPIKYITMVICTKKFGQAEKDAALQLILQCVHSEIPGVSLDSWREALGGVKGSDIISTINRVYLSFVHFVGFSRNLLHESSIEFMWDWIDRTLGVDAVPRSLADFRYSGYFSSRRARNEMCNALDRLIVVTNNWCRDLIAGSNDPIEHRRYTEQKDQKVAVCTFLKELCETSFSLERLNINGRRWGSFGMDTVSQDKPSLFICVSRTDVQRLNEKYEKLINGFRPFEYTLASGMIWWTDYDYNEPLPSPPS